MFRTIFQPLSNRKKKIRILTNEITERQSYKCIHLLGYAILFFMMIDYAIILIPPHFLNPDWEFNTIGKIIDTVYVTLLGYMLVFFRPQQQSVKHSELRILYWLSWLALLLGIVCFLFVPLIIGNSWRINIANQTKINIQLANQNQQAEQLILKLDNLSNRQIQNIWVRNQQASAFNVNVSFREKKQQIVHKINSAEQRKIKQLQQNSKNNQHFLLKVTFKWLLGTIVAGVSFVSIWQYSEWARKFLMYSKERLI